MNPSLIFQIMQAAVAVAEMQAERNPDHDAGIGDTLLQIIETGAEAYRQHTGEPLDLDLIKAEKEIEE